MVKSVLGLILEIILGIFACSALLIAWKFRELSLSAEESGDLRQEKSCRRISNLFLGLCTIVLFLIL